MNVQSNGFYAEDLNIGFYIKIEFRNLDLKRPLSIHQSINSPNMKKSIFTTGVLALCLSLFAQPDFSLENIAGSFNRLVDITNCGDDRLFVVERNGTIRIIQPDGSVLPTPFLNIDPIVDSGQSEQGLLGLAFHPDYLNNGYFYVYYIDNQEDTQLSRFSVSAADPNVADPNSEFKILDTPQPFWNHNGGCIKFGPDGYLYISLGDGGSGGDPQNNGQKRSTFLGKMLRIDVDTGDPYAIPADNPFADDDFTLDEIWSLGLRNVWRFSFDQVTGDMWMGDVGQDDWEEVSFQPASSSGGENYGWRCYEGDHTFNTNGCPAMSEMTFPVYEYSNSFSQGCSVTGGCVYRGCEMPGLYGHYIFADYCSGKFWSITPDTASTNGWKTVELANLNNNNFSAFGENSAGELFAVGHGNGVVYKIISSSGMLTATDETIAGASDGTISFTIPVDQFVETTWSDGSTEIKRINLAPGLYSVTVTTSNACEFIEEIEILGGASPSFELLGINTLTLTPNPFDHSLLLQLESSRPLEAEIQLSEATGRTLRQEQVSINSHFQKEYNLQDLPPGVYIFTIKNDQGEWSERVVKR